MMKYNELIKILEKIRVQQDSIFTIDLLIK